MPSWFMSLHPAVQVALIIACAFIAPPILVVMLWAVAALIMFIFAIISR